MTDQVTELAERGKSLSPGDRARLVDLLLVSLQEPATAEAAWETEIDRRLDEYEGGEVKSIPGEEVIAKARQSPRDQARVRSKRRGITSR